MVDDDVKMNSLHPEQFLHDLAACLFVSYSLFPNNYFS